MKSNLSKLIGSAVFVVGLTLASSSAANAASLDFSFDQFTGDAAEVDISVSDTAEGLGEGDLLFTVKVGEGYIADLTGLYFDISDDSLLSGLSITGLNGVDITASEFKANSVSKVGGQYNNLNGGGTSGLAYDIGVAFGGGGASAGDDYQEASFILSHNSTNLTLSEFSLQDFGVRLKSVGANREGSSKLVGTSTEYVAEVPETPEVPEVPETPETPYTPPETVPEPGMTAALGLLAIGGLCYRKRSKKVVSQS